jgi:hypothetical protein
VALERHGTTALNPESLQVFVLLHELTNLVGLDGTSKGQNAPFKLLTIKYIATKCFSRAPLSGRELVVTVACSVRDTSPYATCISCTAYLHQICVLRNYCVVVGATSDTNPRHIVP